MDDEGNFLLNVDGEDKKLGPAELKAELQKGLSGSARLREAAKAEASVQYASDVEDALDDDAEAYFRVAEARGVSEAEAAEILEYYESGADEDAVEPREAEEDLASTTPVAKAPQVRVVERQVSAEDQRAMDWAHKKQVDEVRDWIHRDLDAGLDSDPRFVTIMKTGGKRADEVRTLARNAVKRIVVSERVEYTDEIRGRVLDELNRSIEVFSGTSGSLPPGAGHAPLSGAPELTHAPRVRQRPDIDSPEYEKYCTGELAAMQEEAFFAD